jgi:tRNA U55 pseudouridine synthase TruB
MAFMDGVLIIDKPAGVTPHDVGREWRILRERRVGTCGTLDPCNGSAASRSAGNAVGPVSWRRQKEHWAVIRLGWLPDTEI